jgi:hypothetical protein
MTPTELRALVEQWPRDAWPKDIGIDSGVYFSPRNAGWRFSLDMEHAALLFEAAGVRWLTMTRFHVVEISPYELVEVKVDGIRYTGPTLLHALTAAFAERGEK